MFTELVPIKFNKIMQTRSYTVVILGTDEKHFAIYMDPQMGKVIQMHLTDAEKQRPFTHDLMSLVFRGLNIQIIQVVINHIQDTIYFARIFIEQQVGNDRHILEIDARPSDCITLALMNNIPVFCTREVLEKAVPMEES